VSLHGKKGLGKKDRKWWRCDKKIVHLKEFGPSFKNVYKNRLKHIFPQYDMDFLENHVF
jgi:hypothetical protein